MVAWQVGSADTPILLLIRPKSPDELGGVADALKRAHVAPPALQGQPAHLPVLDVVVVHIGNLQLASRRRLERCAHVEYAAAERAGVVAMDVSR